MEAARRKIFYAAHVFAAQHEANAPAVDAAQTNYAFDLILTKNYSLKVQSVMLHSATVLFLHFAHVSEPKYKEMATIDYINMKERRWGVGQKCYLPKAAC